MGFLLTPSGVLSMLCVGTADRAMLPIENSLAGTIHKNYDQLLQSKLFIVGERDLRIQHCLMVLPGTSLSDVTHVISHYMALAQCEQVICKHGLVQKAVFDTAGAAAQVNLARQDEWCYVDS